MAKSVVDEPFGQRARDAFATPIGRYVEASNPKCSRNVRTLRQSADTDYCSRLSLGDQQRLANTVEPLGSVDPTIHQNGHVANALQCSIRRQITQAVGHQWHRRANHKRTHESDPTEPLMHDAFERCRTVYVRERSNGVVGFDGPGVTLVFVFYC